SPPPPPNRPPPHLCHPSTQFLQPKRQSVPPLPPHQPLPPPQQSILQEIVIITPHQINRGITRTRYEINNREALIELMLDFLLLFGESILADRDILFLIFAGLHERDILLPLLIILFKIIGLSEFHFRRLNTTQC
ncbi:hypothetical protein ALC57_00031, partial [Trachymyrmex cornetzi]